MPVDALGPCTRALRHKRQISGAELARRSRITRGMISQIERGVAIPSLDVLVRICDGLQVSLAQLAPDVRTGFGKARFLDKRASV
jgi:transcriptional regulator with XRE-family HTH domain